MAEKIEPILSELKSINKRLSDLDEDVNRIDRDLSNDRKDIENLKISFAGVQHSLEGVLNTLTRFQMKTKEAVSDAVTESTAPMEKQMKHFVDMKVLRIKTPTNNLKGKIVEWFNNLKREVS